IPHEAFGLNALNTEINGGGLVFNCEEAVNTQARGFDLYIPDKGGVDNIYFLQADFSNPDQLGAAGNEFSYTATDIENSNSSTSGYAESILYHWYDSGNQEPLTRNGYFNIENEYPNLCESDYCLPPCFGPGDLTDVKDLYYDEISLREGFLADYTTAMQANDFSAATLAANLASASSFRASRTAYDLVQYIWHDTIG